MAASAPTLPLSKTLFPLFWRQQEVPGPGVSPMRGMGGWGREWGRQRPHAPGSSCSYCRPLSCAPCPELLQGEEGGRLCRERLAPPSARGLKSAFVDISQDALSAGDILEIGLEDTRLTLLQAQTCSGHRLHPGMSLTC